MQITKKGGKSIYLSVERVHMYQQVERVHMYQHVLVMK